jgi:hypothetical protein
VSAPAVGDWRYQVTGTRRIGAAGSNQPYDEAATTAVKRTGGTDTEPEMELATSTSNGDQRDTRRYRPAEVLLIATDIKASGLGFAGTLQPPPRLLRWPAKPGDTWQDSWTAGDVQGKTTSKVTGSRDVSTPAGAFRCTDVTSTTTFSGATSGTQTQTACWAPELGMAVVSDGRYQGTYNNVPFDITTRTTVLARP